jgi:hypothetical protein
MMRAPVNQLLKFTACGLAPTVTSAQVRKRLSFHARPSARDEVDSRRSFLSLSRRKIMMKPRAALAALFLLLVAVPDAVAQANKPASAELPVTRVVLFNSGVGYFQREGHVEGNARIDLQFSIGSINDLLKSLVLQDLNGGQISTVNYDSSNPPERTLKSFAIDLTGDPSLGQLLKQARGEKVEVVVMPDKNVISGAGVTMSGVIVGVQQKIKEEGDKEVVVAEQLNLLTADGVRGIPMSHVQRFRFLKQELDQEFRKALEVLANSRDTERKRVSLNFLGQGRRQVKVGYVTENPMWKPSYRLALEKDKVLLQGWAIVENTTDEDWKDIRLGLVAGRPITFQMDLYEPLYVPRPVVEPEIFASLRPPTYQGNLGQQAVPNVAGMGGQFGGNALGFAGGIAGNPNAPPTLNNGPARPVGTALDQFQAGQQNPVVQQDRVKDVKEVIKRLDMSKDGVKLDGVSSRAVAIDLGNYFQYLIEQPVSLPRQKSAMIPIVNQEVKGERVSIFNANVHSKHPLHGLRFKNATALHLMQGPVTIFDEGNYAGDSQVGDLKPNETRYLSYAIDLGSEVLAETKHAPESLLAVKIVKGIVHATNKQRMTSTYTIKNRSEQARKIIVEHPYRTAWKLIEPAKPTEQARDVYRFEQSAEPNKPLKLEVVEEQEGVTRILLAEANDQTLQLFIKAGQSSAKVKASLEKALETRGQLADTRRMIQKEEQAVTVIEQDQMRMRANMERVPPESDAYKRYLKKFDDQETDIEKRRDRITKLQETVESQTQALAEFLQALSVD